MKYIFVLLVTTSLVIHSCIQHSKSRNDNEQLVNMIEKSTDLIDKEVKELYRNINKAMANSGYYKKQYKKSIALKLETQKVIKNINTYLESSNQNQLDTLIEQIEIYKLKQLERFEKEKHRYLNTALDSSINELLSKDELITFFSKNPSSAEVKSFINVLILNIKNIEFQQIRVIEAFLDGEGFVMDKVEPVVEFESNCISVNDSVHANIVLGGFNTSASPRIYIGEPDMELLNKTGGNIMYPVGTKPVLPIKGESYKLEFNNGKGLFKGVASSAGEFQVKGVAEIITTNGYYYIPFFKSVSVSKQ